MVAIHERCGTDVEFLPSRQWYIDVLTDREKYLKAADEIHWHPLHMKKRYQTWVENLKWDWCISRQRYFGVPFPVWYCKDCKQPVLPRQSSFQSIRSRRIRFMPVPAAVPTLSLRRQCLIHGRPPRSRRSSMPDMASRRTVPTSCFLWECAVRRMKIIRTWAFYSIVKSLYHTGRIPWRDIMISGFVLAKPGRRSASPSITAPIPRSRWSRHTPPTQCATGQRTAGLEQIPFSARMNSNSPSAFIQKLYNAARSLPFAANRFPEARDL